MSRLPLLVLPIAGTLLAAAAPAPSASAASHACAGALPDQPRRSFAAVPSRPVSPRIPAGALRVAVCHNFPGPAPVLRGLAARILADTLNHPPYEQRVKHRCRPTSDVALSFSYRRRSPFKVQTYIDDPTGREEDRPDYCGGPVGLAGSRVFALPLSLSDVLQEARGVTGTADAGPTVPDVFGQRLTAAAQKTRRAGIGGMELKGQVWAPAIKPGRVALQSPFPGQQLDRPTGRVEVRMAVGPTPACRRGQVKVSYRHWTSYASSPQVGQLLLSNISRTHCHLDRSITVVGLDAQGRAVTPKRRSRVDRTAVLLSNRLRLPKPRFRPSVRLLAGLERGPIFVVGDYCRHQVTPRWWLVRSGSAVRQRVRNLDRDVDLAADHAFTMCRGRYEVERLYTG
jgi:hypothetical protein